MRIWSRIAAAATAGCFIALIAGTAVNAAEIALMTTAAVDQIMLGLIPQFERASGHKVITTMAKQPDGARELVKYLSLPSSAPVIRKNGMDPA